MAALEIGFGTEQEAESRTLGSTGFVEMGEEEAASGDGGAMIGNEATAEVVGSEVKKMGFREISAEI